ncbi:hypothetical protein NDU88_004378 [Pleurodeles waltl]|uniref:Uncharacterized protein n=1 Tax=Pleurodeles waltl TaxID=8319 RepID=A0AAV7LHW3_PLEWA|nr:hypothetical protein NDU88_004378 [Pleurodeles waltl]
MKFSVPAVSGAYRGIAVLLGNPPCCLEIVVAEQSASVEGTGPSPGPRVERKRCGPLPAVAEPRRRGDCDASTITRDGGSLSEIESSQGGQEKDGGSPCASAHWTHREHLVLGRPASRRV